jgi:hypothetical protein
VADDAPLRAAPQFAYNIAGAEFVPMPRVAAAVQAAIPGAVISFQPGLDGLGYQREALDLRAAARDLGFRPSVSIEAGVQRYVDWMRSQPCVARGGEEADRAARCCVSRSASGNVVRNRWVTRPDVHNFAVST